MGRGDPNLVKTILHNQGKKNRSSIFLSPLQWSAAFELEASLQLSGSDHPSLPRASYRDMNTCVVGDSL